MLLPSTFTSVIGVVMPWPDFEPVSSPLTRSSSRVVGIGPAGLLTTTFQVPSTDAVGSTRVLAAFSALRASRAARPPGPVKVGIVSQPRTAVADEIGRASGRERVGQ